MLSLNRAISLSKRAIGRSPFIYECFMNLLTMNRNLLRQRLTSRHYPSRFGGFWTDRDDYSRLLESKLTSGEIQKDKLDLIHQWREDGYVVLQGAANLEALERYMNELKNLPEQYPKGLKITGGKEVVDREYKSDSIKPTEGIRIVDHYFFSEAVRTLLFSDAVIKFLKVIFESDALLHQTLTFEYGSQQEIHRDTAFVKMNSPMMLVGVWIALEDVREGSGELVYYPGSHHWGDLLFKNKFKHWSEDRDGMPSLLEWYATLHAEAKKRGVSLQKFKARKGDVLIWHADLAHGGAEILDPSLTRRSIVGHFCPTGVRPLYHYLNPKRSTIFKHKQQLYTSSFYP